jgi:hypothetical protein
MNKYNLRYLRNEVIEEVTTFNTRARGECQPIQKSQYPDESDVVFSRKFLHIFTMVPSFVAVRGDSTCLALTAFAWPPLPRFGIKSRQSPRSSRHSSRTQAFA